jgi:phosphatidylglycerol lysyltransferase
LPAVVAEFEQASMTAGAGVCYFGAEARLEAVLRASCRHSMALVGAQPAWTPETWNDRVEAHPSLRAQFNRAANKGVQVREWPAREAGESPRLRSVLDEWLRGRGLPPLHFLVEPSTLERLADRRVFVASRPVAHGKHDDQILAFAVLSPIPARRGWLVEQFPRVPNAPNGTIELLLRHAVRAVTADGAQYLTLGLAPLAKRNEFGHVHEPAWLRLALRWTEAHGNRFYNFGGLERFKAKFQPDTWEPIYAIQRASSFSPRALYAIAGAFAFGSPLGLVAKALAGASIQEVRWLGKR